MKTNLPETSKPPFSPAVIDAAGALLQAAHDPLTPAVLKKRLMVTANLSPQQSRQLIRHMIDSGRWAYVYRLGTAFVEPSFDRPVRVSGRLVLTPSHCRRPLSSGLTPIRIEKGMAFGDGRHPTTRLALQAVDQLMRRIPIPEQVLDVGTGSGVLVMAAVLLGAKQGVGIDIDPCAIAEAKANLMHNRLEHAVCIRHDLETAFQTPPQLILANLRPPTLAALFPCFIEGLSRPGWLVLSGFRCDEADAVAQRFEAGGGRVERRLTLQGWAGVVLAF